MESKQTSVKPYIFTDREQRGMDYYLAFFVWPFGVTLSALSNWRKPWSKNVFWLFCTFFGFTFIISEFGGADSDRYARWFIDFAGSSMSFSDLLNSFYAEGGSYVDIASPLISFLVSRFTANPSVLFAVFGLIFGFFYSRNIWFLLDKVEGKMSFFAILLLFTFALLNPIWNINGFRMWTAAQIFLYGTSQYIVEGKKQRLIWSFVAVLFHFSFLFPLGILWAYVFLGNRVNLYFGLFIATSFINELDLVWVRSLLMYLPDIFHGKVTGYTNTQYAEHIEMAAQALNWYVPFSKIAIQVVVYTVTIFIFFNVKKTLRGIHGLNNLFCFALLFYAGANIFSFIPSGGRYIVVSNTFIFSVFVIYMAKFQDLKGIGLVKVMSVPFLLFYCIFTLRAGMDHYGLMSLMGNPIVAFFQETDTRLIEIVKGFL